MELSRIFSKVSKTSFSVVFSVLCQWIAITRFFAIKKDFFHNEVGDNILFASVFIIKSKIQLTIEHRIAFNFIQFGWKSIKILIMAAILCDYGNKKNEKWIEREWIYNWIDVSAYCCRMCKLYEWMGLRAIVPDWNFQSYALQRSALNGIVKRSQAWASLFFDFLYQSVAK